MDLTAVDTIVARQIPHGLGFAISSRHASGFETEGRDHLYPEGLNFSDAVEKFTIHKQTGGAILSFHWGVVPAYLSGPAVGLSRIMLVGGFLTTLLVAVLVNVLFAQARRIPASIYIEASEEPTEADKLGDDSPYHADA